ncbi:MAG: lysine 2,3-aminomutase [Ignavibacteria bacterium]|nr:lysine 2,3-aminomutase [Ignavibacteria bacterium]
MLKPKTLKLYGLRNIDELPQLKNLSEKTRFALKVVSNILPFRTNNYVVEELIDWDNIPNDPIYQLTFMQKDMIDEESFSLMADALKRNNQSEIQTVAKQLRNKLNPHPSGQLTANIPLLEGNPVSGVQHKYKETVLVFPSSGQTCHAYCTFCFRWAQFVGDDSLKFATDESLRFQEYLKKHKEVTDILFTGGDPMIMSAAKLEAYILPLLQPEFRHIKNIRIGTKSISYWPYKYLTDKDSDRTLSIFEKVINAGKHLTIISHLNHYAELSTTAAVLAVQKIRNTGAVIRAQSPILRHINDIPDVWSTLWQMQVKNGIIPYYMFVERETGAKKYFEMPIFRAYNIFTEAFKKVSGLSKTVRGPVMSANPGKVLIDGISEINNEKVFVLKFIQARNPDWINKPFYAKFDPKATWLLQLEPAFGKSKFFYEDELEEILEERKIDLLAG